MKTPLLLAALVALPLSARERTAAELCAAAQEALSHYAAHRAPGTSRQPIQILQRRSAVSIVGYADGGFALVGNDDSLPAVLGYSGGRFYDDALRYDDDALRYGNDNFLHYLDTFNGYLDYCAAEGIAPRFIGQKANFNPDGVPEIMTCRWDQGAPYNWMSPFAAVDGADKRSLTGCVATAMAQILYTLHEKFGTDVRLRGSKRYAYTDANKQRTVETCNFTTLDFDWDHMCDTYGDNVSYVEGMAVARLMYACGVVSEMNYAPVGSGTYASIADNGINLHFKDVSSTYFGYEFMAYEQDIYDAFDKGYPILITATDKDDNGHAFVGNGYDAEGRIYINFGWSGIGDGFFTLADMGGYIGSQTVTFITPATDDALTFSADAPIDEVAGRYITADIHHPAESIEEGKWYVLYNVGRNTTVYSAGLKEKILNTGYIPVADAAATAAPMIVRFIKKSGTASQYYIQTGTGDYFGGLLSNGNSGTLDTMTKAYNSGHILPDQTQQYFWFKQGSMILDCNAPGIGVTGWGVATPSDTLANNSWQLFPVVFSDQPGMPDVAGDTFVADHDYSIMNANGIADYFLTVAPTATLSLRYSCPVRFLPTGEGWRIVSAGDEAQVVGNKIDGFGVSNSQANGESPLVCYFEPDPTPFQTGDAVLDACSILYRIRCEAGYLAPDKLTTDAPVFCNNGPHADYGRWLVTDRTAYKAMLAGIAPLPVTAPTDPTPSTYDLQGRRVAAPQPDRLYIRGGRKVTGR